MFSLFQQTMLAFCTSLAISDLSQIHPLNSHFLRAPSLLFSAMNKERWLTANIMKPWTQIGAAWFFFFLFLTLSTRNIGIAFQKVTIRTWTNFKVLSEWIALSHSEEMSLGIVIVPLNSMLHKMVLWNSKRPGSDFSLSLFEARTETYLLQSMTNCFCFGKMSKQSTVSLWLNMVPCYPPSEQIWTCPYPCSLLIGPKITHSWKGKESLKNYHVECTHLVIKKLIYLKLCLFSWSVFFVCTDGEYKCRKEGQWRLDYLMQCSCHILLPMSFMCSWSCTFISVSLQEHQWELCVLSPQ